VSVFLRPVEHTNAHPYLILDSGAYSAWKSGKVVDLAAYEAYLRTVKDYLLTAVTLDTIPGAAGRFATDHENEAACIASFKIWKRLRAGPVPVFPVFHQSDHKRWLWRYLEEGATYIGISPTDSFPADVRQHWLITVHQHLLDNGVKLNREVFTHALGVFAPSFLPKMRGMVWSADASSLMQWCTTRRLAFPLRHDGKISHTAEFESIARVYVGERGHHHDSVDAGAVEHYLHAIGMGDHYRRVGERIVMDIYALTAANLRIANLVMALSGVRCFLAGSDQRVMRQAAVEGQYPYLLATYASITEKAGSTIERLYHRNLKLPGSRGRPPTVIAQTNTRGLFDLPPTS
jgi:hypothetical protein